MAYWRIFANIRQYYWQYCAAYTRKVAISCPNSRHFSSFHAEWYNYYAITGVGFEYRRRRVSAYYHCNSRFQLQSEYLGYSAHTAFSMAHGTVCGRRAAAVLAAATVAAARAPKIHINQHALIKQNPRDGDEKLELNLVSPCHGL